MVGYRDIYSGYGRLSGVFTAHMVGYQDIYGGYGRLSEIRI
jgi:hypothetical protein